MGYRKTRQMRNKLLTVMSRPASLDLLPMPSGEPVLIMSSWL
jgi:hypothetical protein